MLHSHLLDLLLLGSVCPHNKNLELVPFLLLANFLALEHDLRVQSKFCLLVIPNAKVGIFHLKDLLVEPVDENFKGFKCH